MIVVICPGIHPSELTDEFVAALKRANISQSGLGKAFEFWVLPSSIAPYAADLIHRYLTQQWQSAELPSNYPIVWIGFSAGVVGAALAARRWQREGGQVSGLIAVDGWGVPLGDRFPRFRLGHDRFTAQSCEWLGASDGYFYCDPALDHLELWRSPQQSRGHWRPNLNSPFDLDFGSLDLRPSDIGQSIDAAHLIAQLLNLLSQAVQFQS